MVTWSEIDTVVITATAAPAPPKSYPPPSAPPAPSRGPKNRMPIALAGPDLNVTIRQSASVYEYNLYRFRGDPKVDRAGRDLVDRKHFEAGEPLVFSDATPLSGSYFYAINATRYTTPFPEGQEPPQTHSWWPIAFRGGLNTFRLGAARLTSDYSESAAVYVGPGDFAVTLDGIEPDREPGRNRMFYSDASAGKFFVIADGGKGQRTYYADAGFKTSFRDGRQIVQYGLAVDSDGNVYTDNAASDDAFGGRLFRFRQTSGAKEHCGNINYFSQMLMFANPVFSGPMIIRPGSFDFGGGTFLMDNLIVVENLKQEVLQVPVNATWDPYRRVGQPFFTIPPGGWGRVVDLAFDAGDNLYVLDGWRVLKVKDGASTTVAYFTAY